MRRQTRYRWETEEFWLDWCSEQIVAFKSSRLFIKFIYIGWIISSLASVNFEILLEFFEVRRSISFQVLDVRPFVIWPIVRRLDESAAVFEKSCRRLFMGFLPSVFQSSIDSLVVPIQSDVEMVFLFGLSFRLNRNFLVNADFSFRIDLMDVPGLIVIYFLIANSQALRNTDYSCQEIYHSLLLVQSLLGIYFEFILLFIFDLLFFYQLNLSLEFLQGFLVFGPHFHIEGLKERGSSKKLLALVVEACELELCQFQFGFLFYPYSLYHFCSQGKLLLQLLCNLIFCQPVCSSQVPLFLFTGFEGQKGVILIRIQAPKLSEHRKL